MSTIWDYKLDEIKRTLMDIQCIEDDYKGTEYQYVISEDMTACISTLLDGLDNSLSALHDAIQEERSRQMMLQNRICEPDINRQYCKHWTG